MKEGEGGARQTLVSDITDLMSIRPRKKTLIMHKRIKINSHHQSISFCKKKAFSQINFIMSIHRRDCPCFNFQLISS